MHTGISDLEFNEIFSVLLLQTGSLTTSLLYLAQLKRSLDVWKAFGNMEEAETMPDWQRPLHRFIVKRSRRFPALWFALMFPVQLVVQMILVLFGSGRMASCGRFWRRAASICRGCPRRRRKWWRETAIICAPSPLGDTAASSSRFGRESGMANPSR
ncbi:hypothetical protein GT003_28145 [Paenibacillus sacheonensis]|uniref:DUF6688 domain-containing protein n=1 Tax=Paenibacillus sacheonensis TaxID=742054 RepID=A0A7X5C1N4_9BACL|nr:DUF6688 family protein [Paenibacillus sacheonensis]NBC72871.1 hypothetical protein [Paenibacillus sacheonensis]